MNSGHFEQARKQLRAGRCIYKVLLLFFCGMVLQKLIRGTLICLMLAIVAAANLVSFSIDADGDAATPPVTVDFHFVAPAQKSVPTEAALKLLVPVAALTALVPLKVVHWQSQFAGYTESPILPAISQRSLPLLC